MSKIVIKFSKSFVFAFPDFWIKAIKVQVFGQISAKLFRQIVGVSVSPPDDDEVGQLSVVERIDHSSISSSFWGLQQQHSKRNPRTKHEKLHYKNVINHATYINYHCSAMGPWTFIKLFGVFVTNSQRFHFHQ